mmetsp:Transcript_35817/g.45980  ORF Transcript_35817/g.45980 Transcript_35817/m.45980 type:complete len:312 (-) Transcript_35817:1055-1990(-)
MGLCRLRCTWRLKRSASEPSASEASQTTRRLGRRCCGQVWGAATPAASLQEVLTSLPLDKGAATATWDPTLEGGEASVAEDGRLRAEVAGADVGMRSGGVGAHLTDSSGTVHLALGKRSVGGEAAGGSMEEATWVLLHLTIVKETGAEEKSGMVLWAGLHMVTLRGMYRCATEIVVGQAIMGTTTMAPHPAGFTTAPFDMGLTQVGGSSAGSLKGDQWADGERCPTGKTLTGITMVQGDQDVGVVLIMAGVLEATLPMLGAQGVGLMGPSWGTRPLLHPTTTTAHPDSRHNSRQLPPRNKNNNKRSSKPIV